MLSSSYCDTVEAEVDVDSEALESTIRLAREQLEEAEGQATIAPIGESTSVGVDIGD